MGPQKSVTIDDKTKIPLFAVLAAFPVLVGGILWLTSIDSKASAAQAELQDTKMLLRQTLGELREIDKKVSRIEGIILHR